VRLSAQTSRNINHRILLELGLSLQYSLGLCCTSIGTNLTPYAASACSNIILSLVSEGWVYLEGYIMTRSALLPKRCKVSKNIRELQRYSAFVTYCTYAYCDQSASPSTCVAGVTGSEEKHIGPYTRLRRSIRYNTNKTKIMAHVFRHCLSPLSTRLILGIVYLALAACRESEWLSYSSESIGRSGEFCRKSGRSDSEARFCVMLNRRFRKREEVRSA
jgi:hypothetical protein